MKRPQLVSQGSLNRIFQRADEAWKRYDFQAAIEMMERASRLNPSDTKILLSLGRMHGLCYDYPTAERYFEKALRVASNKSDILAAAGQQSREFGNFGMAERYFKRALEQNNASPVILVKLAEIYERLRHSEQATSLVENALHSDPTYAPALLLRARLDREAGNLESAEKWLRAFPTNTEPTVRASANYELGDNLARQGRHDEAMAAYLEAKALLRPMAVKPLAELKVLRTRINHLTENTSNDLLKRWFESARQLPPLRRMALLGGHPRSGTTLLEQMLDAHADIVSAEEPEIFYSVAYGPLLRGLPDDTAMHEALTRATPDSIQRARQDYFRAMELYLGSPIAGRLLIDKNPSYTFLIPALIRIFPEIKFLIALRDPRDVVLSCFMQNLPLNQVGAAYLSLESTIEEYTALMSVWLNFAPRICNPYLQVRYEDMVENLESVGRQTLNFLGVPWDSQILAFDEHARRKLVRSPTYADVTKPLYKRAVGRWRNYQKYLEPHLAKLEPFVKVFGYA